MEVYNIISLPITSLNRFFEVKETISCVSVSWIFKLLKGTNGSGHAIGHYFSSSDLSTIDVSKQSLALV
jgi:hypothetical protein